MSDPQTPNKLLYTPAHGADVDFWDQPVNANWNGLDQALGKYTILNANGLTGTIALTASQTIPLGFIIQGTPSGSINYQVPAGQGGIWLVRNGATLGASITLGFSSASGGSTINIPAGRNLGISADGTANGMADIDTVAGIPGGTDNEVQVNVGGSLVGYSGFIYDGAVLSVAMSTTSTGVTQAPGNNSTKLATTAYFDAAAASKAQQVAGTAAGVFVAPATQQYHPSAAKAWVEFDVSGNILSSYNVASVTLVGAAYSVAFTVPFTTVHFGAVACCGTIAALVPTVSNKSVGGCDVVFLNSVTQNGQLGPGTLICYGTQ